MTQHVATAAAVPARRRRRRRWTPARLATEAVLYALVLVLAAIFVAPIVWGFFSSLREMHQGVSGPIIPKPAHWHNYLYAWSGAFPFSLLEGKSSRWNMFNEYATRKASKCALYST